MKCRDEVVRILKAFHRSDRGAALIELAVVLPVLALFAIGVAEFGRLYFAGITVANAAEAGALYGAQTTTSSTDIAGIKQAILNDAADVGVDSTKAISFCGCPDGTATDCKTGTCPSYGMPQVFVQATAWKTVTLLLRYPGLPSTVTISRTATFRAQ